MPKQAVQAFYYLGMLNCGQSGSALAVGTLQSLATSVRPAVAALGVMAAFGAFASPASAATADCSRPADGRKNTVECRISVPGLAAGKSFTYAFVRKGCYHPGSVVSRNGEIVVRRNDIGAGTWHISVAPKPPGKAAPWRFGFRLPKR
jgi:hypothetical protein